MATSQMHAALWGLYGFRATAGLAPSNACVSVAGPIDSLAWATHSPSILRRVATALELPGGRPCLCLKCHVLLRAMRALFNEQEADVQRLCWEYDFEYGTYALWQEHTLLAQPSPVDCNRLHWHRIDRSTGIVWPSVWGLWR